MSAAKSFLDATIPDSGFVELLRWICIFIGGGATAGVFFAFATRKEVATHGRKRIVLLTALSATGLFCVLQEWQQLHHPMTWWRLPLLLLIALCLAYVLYGPDDPSSGNGRS